MRCTREGGEPRAGGPPSSGERIAGEQERLATTLSTEETNEPGESGTESRGVTRRQFLRHGLGALGAGAALTGLYTWRVEPEWLEFVDRPLPVRGLPRELVGRTLVQVSDIHVGPVDSSYLIETFRRTAALAPDFVVATGDFVTAGYEDAAEELARILPEFPRGALGTVAILGNHDYGFRWSTEKSAARVVAALDAAEIPVLRNESVSYAGLQFVGLDDLWSGRFDPDAAYETADPDAPTIVLSHNPDTVDLPGLQEDRGWILCGHTHGGQCKPPFLPPPILPVRNRRYTAGEFRLSGGRRMYINRGVGYVLRVRFNVRPEVTVFRLERS